jgi:hypothetical protein
VIGDAAGGLTAVFGWFRLRWRRSSQELRGRAPKLGVGYTYTDVGQFAGGVRDRRRRQAGAGREGQTRVADRIGHPRRRSSRTCSTKDSDATPHRPGWSTLCRYMRHKIDHPTRAPASPGVALVETTTTGWDITRARRGLHATARRRSDPQTTRDRKRQRLRPILQPPLHPRTTAQPGLTLRPRPEPSRGMTSLQRSCTRRLSSRGAGSRTIGIGR